MRRASSCVPLAACIETRDQGCAICTALPLSAPAPQGSFVCRLHCLAFVGTSSTGQAGHLQVPASRRHDERRHLQCLVLLALALQSSRATIRCPSPDNLSKAMCQVHCLVVSAPVHMAAGLSKYSNTDTPPGAKQQTGHLQVPALRRHDHVPSGCLSCLSWCSRVTFRCLHLGDMMKAVPSALPCHVGTSLAAPAPCRRQLLRAVGTPSGACIEAT